MAAGDPPPDDPQEGAPNGGADKRDTPYRRQQEQLNVDGVALGKRVRRLRSRRGWTQEQLSDVSGVPVMTISDLEGGRTAKPHPALSSALAETFDYASPAALLAGGPHAEAGPGALTLEGLVASLLRGVWAAQDSRPGPDSGKGAAARVAGAITLAVGVVVLADGPRVEGGAPPPRGPPVVSSQATPGAPAPPAAGRRRGVTLRAP